MCVQLCSRIESCLNVHAFVCVCVYFLRFRRGKEVYLHALVCSCFSQLTLRYVFVHIYLFMFKYVLRCLCVCVCACLFVVQLVLFQTGPVYVLFGPAI